MNLRLVFHGLEQLVRQMNADPVYWVSNGRAPKTDIRALLEAGLFEFNDLGAVEVGRDGSLALHGYSVAVYIKDTQVLLRSGVYSVDELPKFHIAECLTLRRMKAMQRYDRYVATRRVDGSLRLMFVTTSLVAGPPQSQRNSQFAIIVSFN